MQKIKLNKGDLIVLKTDIKLTPEQREGLQNEFDGAIERVERGETVAVVLECGIDFDVVKVNAGG